MRTEFEHERGSALLIVFVFAAIVAIMLYKSIPDAFFESQRQKEQVLIDRGKEYKTAIKRFYTRNQRYPTSLEQRDNFNNVRYSRRRFGCTIVEPPGAPRRAPDWSCARRPRWPIFDDEHGFSPSCRSQGLNDARLSW